MSRELDARVAREVMGWDVKGWISSYSTDMNAAMEVVAHFDALGWIWTLQSELNGRWLILLTCGPQKWIKIESDDGLPKAICHAALEAAQK